MSSDPLDFDAILADTFVDAVEHHRALDSTNNRALKLARGRCGGLPRLIVADRQTAGRGRGSHRWWTGPGALAFSILIDVRPYAKSPADALLTSLAAGIAVCEAVEPRLAGAATIGLHWPNDVYAGGRKLAGVLIEAPPGGLYVVGIGVNVNNRAADAPAELRDKVATLRDLTGGSVPRTGVLIDVLRSFQAQLRRLADDPDGIGAEAHRRCLQLGRTIEVDTGAAVVCGTCRGIAPDGALLLQTDEGPRAVHSGTLRDPGFTAKR